MSISRVLAVTIAVVSLAGWSAGQVDASIVIDNYSVTGPLVFDAPPTPPGTSGTPTAFATGGSRQLTLETTAGLSTGQVISGIFLTNLLVPGSATTSTLAYSFGPTFNGSNLDFTQAGLNDAFVLSALTNASMTGTISLSVNGGPAVIKPLVTSSSLVFLFSDFANEATFTNVTSLLLSVSGTSGAGTASFSVSELSAAKIVPEPSSMLMAGLGLVGLIGAARRRRSV